MTRVRIVRVEIAGDLSHALVVGTTDGNTVKVEFAVQTEVGIAFALVAAIASPVEIEVPNEVVGPGREIDSGSLG